MFAYSMRERTHAHRRMKDNVPEDVKQQRLVQMIDTFKRIQLEVQREDIGAKHLVLLDGHGKKDHQVSGLTDTMKRAVFTDIENKYKIGDMCLVEVTDASQNALICEPIELMSVQGYFSHFG
jgi:tRNA-2-methylthio-N6-dimethylallyladenosine synthase